MAPAKVHPIKSNQNLRVFWKFVNLQDCVWENHCRLIMKTILQEKETIHCSITIWYTNLFLCFKQMNITDAKAAVDKEWTKLEKIPAWQLTKVRNKKVVIAEARNKGRNVHFASLMDLCHLKNSEQQPQVQKYKGRIVLGGDIVKDDSDNTQYSLNKDHQHHKWQQQRSWISYPDCQDAQDKQRTQYLLIPR